jgi:uncharacterized protein
MVNLSPFVLIQTKKERSDMATYLAPDVYVEEVPGGVQPIEPVGTRTAGFVGVAPDRAARVNEPVPINNWSQFTRIFMSGDNSSNTTLSRAVYGFFLNGGSRCYVVNIGDGRSITGGGGRSRVGLDVLQQVDEVAIVAAPGYVDPASYDALLSHCEARGDRVAILDGPETVADVALLTEVATVEAPRPGSSGGEGTSEGEEEQREPARREAPARRGLRARPSDGGYGAQYFPWITVRDADNPDELINVPPSGHIAGIWARNDATRGVHKAPANEIVQGALNVSYPLTRDEVGELNRAGVNSIRSFAREGIRVWGGRTLAGSASEWRYLNVRRLVNMIKESIELSTRWIVFEPNDYTLWKSIIRDVTAFLTIIWRSGALLGRTPEQAFFVKCDEETNPPEIIDAGMVVTLIGIAPVKPAEFIIFRISQFSGAVESNVQGGA